MAQSEGQVDTKNSFTKKTAKKERIYGAPYTLVVFLLFIAILATGLCVYALITWNREIEVCRTEMSEVQRQVDELMKEDSASSDIPSFYPGGSDNINHLVLADTLNIMQSQYDNFLSQLTLILSIFTIAVSLFTLAIPLFNHFTIQKDQVARLNQQSNILQGRLDEFEEFMKNAKAQNYKLSEAIVSKDNNFGDISTEIPSIGTSDEDRAHAAYLNARIAFSLGDYKRAESAINEAITLDGTSADYLHFRGMVYHKMKEYQKALEDENKAIDLAPMNARFYHSRGITLHEMGRYDVALRDKTKAIELDPENAILYGFRGITLHEMGRYEEALNDETKAIELDPENAISYGFRGVTLHEMGRYDEALTDKSKAIELDSKNAMHYHSRSTTLHMMGRYEEALNDETKAIELDSKNAIFYDSRGVTLHDMGRYDEALNNMNKAIELDPMNARFYDSRSTTLHEMGRYDEALNDTNKAIELDPKNDRYLAHRGAIFFMLHDYASAMSDLRQALKGNEENVDFAFAHGYLGLLKLKMALKNGDPLPSDEDVTRGLGDHRNFKSYLRRAQFYLLSSKPEQAEDDLNKAFALNPKYPDILHWFGKLYEARGDADKAADYYAQAKALGYIPKPEP